MTHTGTEELYIRIDRWRALALLLAGILMAVLIGLYLRPPIGFAAGPIPHACDK